MNEEEMKRRLYDAEERAAEAENRAYVQGHYKWCFYTVCALFVAEKVIYIVAYMIAGKGV